MNKKLEKITENLKKDKHFIRTLKNAINQLFE